MRKLEKSIFWDEKDELGHEKLTDPRCVNIKVLWNLNVKNVYQEK
jgi:hypothetical protein